VASASFRAALKLQFLTPPCPALLLQPSRIYRPLSHRRGSPQRRRSITWAARPPGAPSSAWWARERALRAAAWPQAHCNGRTRRATRYVWANPNCQWHSRLPTCLRTRTLRNSSCISRRRFSWTSSPHAEPGGSGAIAKYLTKFGEGVQQVEFRCANVDRATQILKDKFRVAPVYPAPRHGSDGTRVNFFLVASPDGGRVLIELYELPSRG